MSTAVAEADPATSAVAFNHQKQLKHGLTPGQLEQFRDIGYVVLRGQFPAEDARRWQEAADTLSARADLVDKNNLRVSLAKEQNSDRKLVWKFDPFVDISETFGQLSRDRRLLDPLASIYDGFEPRLFKDKLIFKPAGTEGSHLHQDYNWWQGYPRSLISVLVAIDPADASNGATELFPDRTRALLTTPGRMNDKIKEEQIDLARGEMIETTPGDVVLFNCFVPHRAGRNNSNRTRRQIFFTYNDARDGEFYQSHRDHYCWYVTRHLPEGERGEKYFR